MKQITFKFIASFTLILSISLFTQSVFAQQITNLRVHRMANDASVNWSSTDPSNVVYFLIERSYDGEIFETVAEIPSNGTSNYRYRDITVLPGIISYRVTSFNQDGGSFQSPIDVLRLLRRK